MAIVLNSKAGGAPDAPRPSRVKSAESGLEKLKWVLFGPPKAGKTRLASTIGNLTGDDIFWIMADTNGANSLLADGIGVPYMLDLQQVRIDEKLTFAQLVQVVKEELEAFRAKNEGKDWKIVFDGLTMVDSWIALECPRDSSGKPEWTSFKSMHLQMFDAVNKFQRATVFLAHAAADIGNVRLSADKKKEADADAKLVSGTQEGEIVKPAITGGALNIYRAAADVIGFQLKVEEKYYFYPDGGDKAQGGNRFAKFLPQQVENANLKTLTAGIIEQIKVASK